MPLAPKGSKSSINKQSNAAPKYAPNNPIDKSARKALSKGAVAKGKGIKLDGAVVSLAATKTANKAEQKSVKRARSK